MKVVMVPNARCNNYYIVLGLEDGVAQEQAGIKMY